MLDVVNTPEGLRFGTAVWLQYCVGSVYFTLTIVCGMQNMIVIIKE